MKNSDFSSNGRQPIHVLQILEATVGGTRRHLVSLVSRLDKHAFKVDVAAPALRHGTRDDTSFAAEIRAAGITLHEVNMYREIRPFADLDALFTLTRLIRKNHYDLVHTHSSKAGFLGRVAAKLNRLPVIYTPNGFYFQDTGHWAKRNLFLGLEKAAGWFTDTLIAVSESERAVTLDNHLVSPDRAITIPNAIDPALFVSDIDLGRRIRAELGIGQETNVIGTVSRYIPQKDPLTLVKAASLVVEQQPEVCFIWCGEGDLRTETEALAQQLGISSHFRFLGFRPDVLAIMNAFDLFVLSSLFEGLPYTLLEVMALGKPVVATAVVGNRDVVVEGETGLLVPPQNPFALAQAMIALLGSSEQRFQMGQAGRQRILSQFSIERMVAATEAVYRSVLR